MNHAMSFSSKITLSSTHFHAQLKRDIRDQNMSYFQQRHNLARSGIKRGSAAYYILGLRFRIPPRVGCLSLVSVVCWEVEVSATIRSLVYRSPTEYMCVIVCDQVQQ
jgi:hypothetical protein